MTKLQEQLRACNLDPGPVDGTLGPRTTAAVTEFQRGGQVVQMC
ncbi:MAG: peptidoglycan-binding protein [Polyangiaceae bacterium]|nr:peptidoglycan-binding protein [Polyangiaceae bacterium]